MQDMIFLPSNEDIVDLLRAVPLHGEDHGPVHVPYVGETVKLVEERDVVSFLPRRILNAWLKVEIVGVRDNDESVTGLAME